MLIKPDTQSMHQKRTQQALAQMPQIASPNALQLATIRQLPKDGINERANLAQDGTLKRFGLGYMRFAKRGLQNNPHTH